MINLNQKLSDSFILAEFVHSEDIGTLTQDHVDHLTLLCTKVLQPLRDYMATPVRVTSGYRSIDTNTRVGGAKNSDHLYGFAADIETSDNKKAFRFLQKLQFKQLINEKNLSWIHVSYDKDNNWRQILSL